MDRDTGLLMFSSLGELMEYSHTMPSVSEAEFPYANLYWKQTETGTKFNGCEATVYDEYKNHKFSQFAKLGDTAELSRLCSGAEFNVERWQFARRLDEGDGVDVDRWKDGHDRCWTGVRRQIRPKPTVRVYVSFGGNCGRSANELKIAGQTAVRLVEALEAAGRSVELWGVTKANRICDSRPKNLLSMIRLKAQDEYCDIPAIGWALGYDKLFRCQWFRAWCRHYTEKYGKDVASGLGTSATVTLSDLGLSEEEKSEAVLLPHFYTELEARQWMDATFDRLKK